MGNYLSDLRNLTVKHVLDLLSVTEPGGRHLHHDIPGLFTTTVTLIHTFQK